MTTPGCTGCDARHEMIGALEKYGERLLDVAMILLNAGDLKALQVLSDELRKIGREMESRAERMRLT
jgi:hypothetical protein